MDVFESLRGLFQDFHAGPFIGVATVLYIVINILRGKYGLRIPWLSDAWDKLQSKSAKTWIILGLFGLTGLFTALGNGETNVWVLLDAMLAGFGVGFGTLGLRTTAKNTLESDGVQTLKTKMKEAFKKDENKS